MSVFREELPVIFPIFRCDLPLRFGLNHCIEQSPQQVVVFRSEQVWKICLLFPYGVYSMDICPCYSERFVSQGRIFRHVAVFFIIICFHSFR